MSKPLTEGLVYINSTHVDHILNENHHRVEE